MEGIQDGPVGQDAQKLVVVENKRVEDIVRILFRNTGEDAVTEMIQTVKGAIPKAVHAQVYLVVAAS